jgi:hypothetical protein
MHALFAFICSVFLLLFFLVVATRMLLVLARGKMTLYGCSSSRLAAMFF